jgi:hypothetical protein
MGTQLNSKACCLEGRIWTEFQWKGEPHPLSRRLSATIYCVLNCRYNEEGTTTSPFDVSPVLASFRSVTDGGGG